MLVGEIFEDFGLARKNVWRVRDGKVTQHEMAALASSTDLKPRTRVETTDNAEEDDDA